MAQKETQETFGAKLRYFRGRAINRKTGKPLSQEELARGLTERTGLSISRNRVHDWETEKTRIQSQTDRFLLIDLINVLHKHKGIGCLDEANQLLNAGDYRSLNNDEIKEINSEWLKPLPPVSSPIGPKAEFSSLPTGSPKGGQNLKVSVDLPEPFPIVIHRQNPGPGSAPPAPSLIIGRDEDLSTLRENLCQAGAAESPIQILTAIKGWPGVGKTTIASALAYDEKIKNQFSDGILWVSLGKDPNLLSELAAWGRALGTDELLHARTLEEAQGQLAALLREKRMLLIIDDVWRPEHAIPFKVGGPQCATLVTTRRDAVANALAPNLASIYRLKVLKDEDALDLLKELALDVVNKYPNESMSLVKELEGLPLALQVAGRLLHAEADRGLGVTELLEDLRVGAKLLEAAAPADRVDLVTETTPTIAALLLKSLDFLDEHTRDCYAYLGVFAPRPATFDLEAMKFVWEAEDPKPIVAVLIDHGLLEYVKELDRYWMHSTMVMLAKSLLKED